MHTVIFWGNPREITHLSKDTDRGTTFSIILNFFINNCEHHGDINRHYMTFIDGNLVYRRQLYRSLPQITLSTTNIIIINTKMEPRIQLGNFKKLFEIDSTRYVTTALQYKLGITRNTLLKKIETDGKHIIFKLGYV